jgi:hypothetical protein
MPVILDEGAPTVGASGTYFDTMGTTAKNITWAYPLAEGELVALSNDTGNTWALTRGIAVVERAQTTESLVIGRIRTISSGRPQVEPAASADADTLAERLAGRYYRTAVIEVFVANGAYKAEVYHDGSNAVAIGVVSDLSVNITSEYASTRTDRTTEIKLMANASSGAGFIPCHYVASGSSGDLSNCLVLPYTLAAAHTGA